MLLEGSCQCGAVKFTVRSPHPYPYQLCYCSICRKTQGGGGYAINLSAEAKTLRVTGRKHITVYHAHVRNPEDARGHTSTAERNFCSICGSALWLFSPEWPDLLHPFASAIDSELPATPEHTYMMLEFKPGWVEVEARKRDRKHQRYPDESIADWHDRLHLTQPE